MSKTQNHRNSIQQWLAVDGGWRLVGRWRLAVRRAVLKGKKSVPLHSFPEEAHGYSYFQPWLVAIGGWRLVAVGSGWRLVAASGWPLVAVGGWWSLRTVLKGSP